MERFFRNKKESGAKMIFYSTKIFFGTIENYYNLLKSDKAFSVPVIKAWVYKSSEL